MDQYQEFPVQEPGPPRAFNGLPHCIVANMNTVETGMLQKRILNEDGQKQLARLKKIRDKLYVDNQNNDSIYKIHV